MVTIATTERVDREALLDFVRGRHQITLLTHRRDGRPQLSPVTCSVGYTVPCSPNGTTVFGSKPKCAIDVGIISSGPSTSRAR